MLRHGAARLHPDDEASAPVPVRGHGAALRSAMAETSETAEGTTTDRRPPLREAVYRYLFYGWLFRDADSGSALERALALRHNQAQARWLPLYLWRWFVLGAVLWALAQATATVAVPALSLALDLMFVFVAMYLLLTTIFWAFLSGSRLRGDGS